MSTACAGSLFSVSTFGFACFKSYETFYNVKDMDKNKLCEAMYALPGEVVVRRRKSLLMPAVLFVAGAAMIVVNNLYASELTNNLSSGLVFLGGMLVLSGMIFSAVRLFGSEGAPFHRGERRFLHYDEIYFDRTNRGNVMQTVDAGDVQQLLAMPHAQVPAVAVAIYRTKDNRFAAMQAFEYAELEYKPLTDLKIVNG